MRLLFICPEPFSPMLLGPNLRVISIARELAKTYDVTVVSEGGDPPDLGLDALEFVQWDKLQLSKKMGEFDLVFSQGLNLPFSAICFSKAALVMDLYDPILMEQLGMRRMTGRQDTATDRYLALRTASLLRQGDFFLCASTQQRDLWLGGLYANGRLVNDPDASDDSPDRLVGVVPFGILDTPPEKTGPGVKGVREGINEDDHLLVWGGGIWNWFDPLTLLEAMKLLRDQNPKIKLLFFARGHHSGCDVINRMANDTYDRAKEWGLLDETVFFAEKGVPFQDRMNIIMESDLAVSTSPEGMENHFSYRTRLMDAIWSGLPTVCTRDGFIADWLEDIGGGITVPESDPQALADAILEGLQPDRHTAMKDALLANRHQFYWSECVKPLEAYCKKLEDNPRIPPTKIAGCLAYLTYKVQAWYALKIEPRLRPRK